MANSFNIFNPIQVSKVVPNVDATYGPYASMTDALNAFPKNRRVIGRTVAIIDGNNSVTEYWWKDGIEDNNLVVKGATDSPLYFNPETPPTDTHKIWVDTDSQGTPEYSPDGLVASLTKRVTLLEAYVQKLVKIIEYGAIAGDSSIGGRSLMESSTTPINPITGEIEDQDEPTTQGVVTIPNFSPKIDTSYNFKKNMNNLIDGELVWIRNGNNIKEGDLGLFIVANNKEFVGFLPCSSGSSPVSDLEVMVSDGVIIINGSGAKINGSTIEITSSKASIDSDNYINF